MASPRLVHAAYFAIGTLVGGGVATAVTTRRRPIAAILPNETVCLSPAVIELGPSGSTRLSSTALAVSTESSVLKYGDPGPVSDFLDRKAYVAAYDRRLRHPAWTAEHLTLSSLTGDGDRLKSTFTEDTSLPLPFRALLKDYFRSGYDRGHMAPAANAKISQEAMNETFLLSNMAPQVGVGFNRHYWAYLEDWCRRLTGSFSDVYIFTVPLYLPRQELDGKWRVDLRGDRFATQYCCADPFCQSASGLSPITLDARYPRDIHGSIRFA